MQERERDRGRDWSDPQKRLSKPKTLQFRGRLGFAENQIFGRASKQATRVLIEHAFHAVGVHVGEDLNACLTSLRDMVENGADREISGVSCLTFVILTDASYEEGKEGIEGILIGPSGKLIEYFSYFLTPDEMNKLGAQEKQTITHGCEMIAIPMAIEKGHAGDLLFG